MANDLEFRIGAELTEIKGALASLRRDFAGVGQAAQQAGGNRALAGLEGSVGGAVRQVKALVAGFVTLAGVVKLIAAADELNSLNARLKLVTGSTEEFQQAQVKLFDLAQRTRSSLGETISLYARIASATKDAGVGQETLLGVVETINQAVQLSGASTQAAEAALVQLGQGLASGTLRGEELNSILEQTPALADAIAKGLGVTRGELRQLGQDGKLSAQEVLRALQAQRDEVAKQFAQLPLTVGQSLTLLKNAGLQIVGAFDAVTGATGGLAGVIKDLADFLSSDEVIGSIVEFAAAWGNAFATIVEDAKQALAIIEEATANFAGTGENAVQIVIRAFLELPRNLRTVARILTAGFAAIVDSIVADAVLAKEAIAAIFTDDTIDAALERRNRRVQANLQALRDFIDDEVASNRQAAADAKKVGKEAVAARNAARTTQGSNAQGTFKNKPSADAAKAAESLRKAQLEAQEKLLEDSTKRELALLESYYADGIIGATAYFTRRQEIELEALDRSIAIERERAAGSANPAERVKALAQVELLERQRLDIVRRGADEQRKAEADLQRELEGLRAQDLENQGKTAEAAAIRLEAQFAELRKRLTAAGNEAGVALIDKLIDTGKAQARFDEIKAQFDRTVADLQARQQQIADQRATGAMPADTAQQQQADAQRAAVERLRALNAELQALAADPAALPAIKDAAEQANQAFVRLQIDGMTGLDRAIVDLRAQLRNLQEGFAQATVGAGVDAITGLFTDLASGTKSAGDALKDFVRGFAQSMAQIAARALATFLVLQLLDSFFPGAGKLVAATGSASVQHSGGMAGTGPKRKVDTLLFAGAPRYHSGGMVGLKSDEVPAILQTGEEVLSRDDPRNAANGGGLGGGASGGGTRIINVLDPNLVQDYMQTPSGERVLLNVIERNAGAIRQKLMG